MRCRSRPRCRSSADSVDQAVQYSDRELATRSHSLVKERGQVLHRAVLRKRRAGSGLASRSDSGSGRLAPQPLGGADDQRATPGQTEAIIDDPDAFRNGVVNPSRRPGRPAGYVRSCPQLRQARHEFPCNHPAMILDELIAASRRQAFRVSIVNSRSPCLECQLI